MNKMINCSHLHNSPILKISCSLISFKKNFFYIDFKWNASFYLNFVLFPQRIKISTDDRE